MHILYRLSVNIVTILQNYIFYIISSVNIYTSHCHCFDTYDGQVEYILLLYLDRLSVNIATILQNYISFSLFDNYISISLFLLLLAYD